MREEMETKVNEQVEIAEKLKKEHAEMLEQYNMVVDKNLKIEEMMDAKNEKIVQLERDLARRTDEIGLRKEVIDSMGQSLMQYEED